MSSFWAWIYVLLDNLCIILIDLSTAALPRLNRLLADRSLNLLLDAIFHTWLLRSRQIADDPITNTFDRAWAVGMSKLKVSYGGEQCVSPSHSEGEVPGPKARCWALGSWRALLLTCPKRGCWCPAHSPPWGSPVDSSCFLPLSVWGCPAHSWGRLQVFGEWCLKSTCQYHSAFKTNAFESILMRWMKLELIIQGEVSQKEKHQYSILMHTYGI